MIPEIRHKRRIRRIVRPGHTTLHNFPPVFNMPARVEFILGDIFQVPCDLLVIPTSVGGTVTPGVAEQIRKAGLRFPDPTPWGSVSVKLSENPYIPRVAYAAAVRGQSSSPEIVEKLGQELGRLAREMALREISAPLLGSGAGDVPLGVAAAALERGFLAMAPDDAVLRVSIRDPATFAALKGVLKGAGTALVRTALRSMRGSSRPGLAAVSPAPWAGPTAPPAAQPPGAAVDAGDGGAASAAEAGRTRVFISYSHADVAWLERLQKHLAPLEREGADVWDDTRIKAGAHWREEIREALARTKVAILLISADFLASPFIVTDELPPLLQAAKEDGAVILPVIISPCRFERMESLSRFQAVNDPKKPLVKLRRGNREEALDEVARAVEDALKPSPGTA